jgi:transcriptional regulator with XRE-family HTH domain
MSDDDRTVYQDGEEIRRLRERSGLNVPAFAAKVGITSQAMSNIELGNRSASLGVLIRIARELGVRLDLITKQDAA